MKLTDYLSNKKSSETLFSIEITAPRETHSIEDIQGVMDSLKNYTTFVSVTARPNKRWCEQMDYGKEILRVKKDGLDTNSIGIYLNAKYGVETVPHLICLGFTKDETEDALLSLKYFKIDNLVALRGEHTSNNGDSIDKRAYAIKNGFKYGYQLVKRARKIGDFCVIVPGYPEGYIGDQNKKRGLENLKKKIEVGANVIFTQAFAMNSHFYKFRDKVRRLGIEAPIIPGIKPIILLRHVEETFPKIFNAKVPKKLCRKMRECKKEDREKIGLEYTIEQCLDLVKNGVECIHFYTMNNSAPTKRIIEAIK